MNSNLLRVVPSGSVDPGFADLVEELTARFHAGEPMDLEACVRDHPEHAERLQALFPALAMLAELSQFRPRSLSDLLGTAEEPEPASGQLGDFRILREVGRGGMGVVYEAEQISLKRRVALKVLPFAATMDPRQLQRFHNEAQAAASLHHPHIVPVHAVGYERGVHYYAMQFIDGQTLAEFIRLQKQEPAAVTDKPVHAEQLPSASGPSAPTQPKLAARQSTVPSLRGKAYFANVARLGIQAAEALEHAHALGIVHRDVKPGNLMLDGHGELWVTDFGLARTAADSSLTMTGDVLGTLRYMSPEQALAKHGLVDHRTDVYALGVTLYELLTLRPAIDGKDRQEILHKIANEEPANPRKVNRLIPVDLETIVLKAMAKEPQARYATAKELAEDLRRSLDNKPIRAKRPSWLQRTRKLIRRNRVLVGSVSAVVLLSLVVIGAGLGWVWRDRAALQERAEDNARGVLRQADDFFQRKEWWKAQELTRRAEDQLRLGGGEDALYREVEQRLTDLKMALLLEEIPLRQAATKDGQFDIPGANGAYEEAFRDYGIDVKALPPAEAARLIQASALRLELTAALDNWALTRVTAHGPKDKSWRELVQLARTADSDAKRDLIRRAFLSGNYEALVQTAATMEPSAVAAPTVLVLASQLEGRKHWEKTAVLLRKALQTYPSDLWINVELARCLQEMGPAHRDEAISYLRVACVLRPQSAGVHLNLGNRLLESGRGEDAQGAYQKALAIDPNYAQAHYNLGNALYTRKDLKGAIRHYTKAIELNSKYDRAHHNLGNALRENGDLDGAIQQYQKAIAINPKSAGVHNNLGVALCDKKDLAGAIREYRRAIELDPKLASAHIGLGNALADKKDLAGAIQAYRRAIELDSKDAKTHYNLGHALYTRKDLAGAIRHFQNAIDINALDSRAHLNLGTALYYSKNLHDAINHLKTAVNLAPRHAEAHRSLGIALEAASDLEGAAEHFQTAVALDPKNSPAHLSLGIILRKMGNLAGAVEHYQKALELDPRNVNAHICLGNALRGQKNVGGATEHFRKAIELEPQNVQAHTELGGVLALLGKWEEALREYREALNLDPKDATIHYNLGVICADRRDLADAIQHFSRAIDLDPNYSQAHYNLGNALRDKKDLDGAIRHYTKAVQINPNFTWAHLHLGNAFRNKKNLAGAIRCYRAALAVAPNYVEAHINLGNALKAQGDLDGAIRHYHKALASNPRKAEAHGALGQALLYQGRFHEARQAFTQALDLFPPSQPAHKFTQEQLRNCDRLLAFDAKLSAVLQGQALPTDAQEYLDLARFCLVKKRHYRTAAQLFAKAFAAWPDLATHLDKPYRYDAACAAVLTETGQGNDAGKLTNQEKVAWRQQALQWLRADLKEWSKILRAGSPLRRPTAVEMLRHWQKDNDLAGVRDPAALAKLPGRELRQWREFWSEVRELIQETDRPTTGPAEPAGLSGLVPMAK